MCIDIQVSLVLGACVKGGTRGIAGVCAGIYRAKDHILIETSSVAVLSAELVANVLQSASGRRVSSRIHAV